VLARLKGGSSAARLGVSALSASLSASLGAGGSGGGAGSGGAGGGFAGSGDVSDFGY
jgi:hypothetical protein